jgi:anti-anti-sigma regulatory factor
MATPSVNLSVWVGKNFACVKITGRANFGSSPEFKALLTGLMDKGYGRFLIDLSECILMDSTFLGTLAQFGLKLNSAGSASQPGVELFNPNARITELLENLGTLQLFKTVTGTLELPGDMKPSISKPVNPTHEQITRTCLEAHQTLMAVNPDNIARFKDVTQFLAEDLNSLEKRQ